MANSDTEYVFNTHDDIVVSHTKELQQKIVEESDVTRITAGNDLIVSYIKMLVNDFTEQSGYRPSDYFSDPVEARKKIVINLIEMVLSELTELLQTRYSLQESINVLKKTLETVKAVKVYDGVFKEKDTIISIVKQCMYYVNSLNVEFLTAFTSIHSNNMQKRFPDGKFHLRPEDGKVLKPDNFKEVRLLICQILEGSEYTSLDKDELHDFVESIMFYLADLVHAIHNNNSSISNVRSKLLEIINGKKDMHPVNYSDVLRGQVDGLIDVSYYCLNAYSKLNML